MTTPAPGMRRALALVSLAALALPASASAHASLIHGYPAFRQRLAHPPREILLRFDQTVNAVPGSIVVLTPDGRNVAAPALAVPAKAAIVAR
ncbi:MAG: copper resistance protein CopC, partial [Gaiellaceae bacterium]